jgi:hypothetical protein
MPRIGRIALACVVLATLAGQGHRVCAETPVPAREVRFHAEGLERPLLLIRAANQLVRQCATRFRAQCSEKQIQTASSSVSVVDYLDLLTTFGAHVDQDPAKPVESYEQLQARLAAVGSLLLEEASQYDRKLFARFGATLRVCPPADVAEYRKSLAQLQELDLRRFAALADDDYSIALAHIELEETSLAEVMRRDWSSGDCVAARTLGDTLLQLLYQKLKPWMDVPRAPPNEDEARSATAYFMFLAAFELESRVNPGVQAQILEKRRQSEPQPPDSN